MKIGKILVPVDFSSCSENALKCALFWGEKFGAELVLLHINTLFQEPTDYDEFAYEVSDILAHHDAKVRKWLEEKTGTPWPGRVQMRYEVVQERSAARGILDLLEDDTYDLIVMGTHGRSGISRFALGSVAEKVCRLSPVPVLTVHQTSDRFDINNILVPVDLSETSHHLVKRAVDIAATFDAGIHLLYVFEHPSADAFEWLTDELRASFELDPDVRYRILQIMNGYIDSAVSNWHIEVIQRKSAYREIVDYAQNKAVDMIIMATRGLSKLDYFLLWGSNTERVVRFASCPVLSVRWKELGRKHQEELSGPAQAAEPRRD